MDEIGESYEPPRVEESPFTVAEATPATDPTEAAAWRRITNAGGLVPITPLAPTAFQASEDDIPPVIGSAGSPKPDKPGPNPPIDPDKPGPNPPIDPDKPGPNPPIDPDKPGPAVEPKPADQKAQLNAICALGLTKEEIKLFITGYGGAKTMKQPPQDDYAQPIVFLDQIARNAPWIANLRKTGAAICGADCAAGWKRLQTFSNRFPPAVREDLRRIGPIQFAYSGGGDLVEFLTMEGVEAHKLDVDNKMDASNLLAVLWVLERAQHLVAEVIDLSSGKVAEFVKSWGLADSATGEDIAAIVAKLVE
jgi:hypothetical protein